MSSPRSVALPNEIYIRWTQNPDSTDSITLQELRQDDIDVKTRITN